MQRNVAGQRWAVFAYQGEGGANPGQPVTGDAANITANLRIDGGAANAVDDTNPTELEDGFYVFDITAAESNGEHIVMTPASATANTLVIGVPGAVWTTPANFNDLDIETDGDLGGNLNGNVGGSVGSVTGNVAGSVGSVVGAVGSVTGAVGSVTGSVGSVVAAVTANVTQIAGSTTAATRLSQTLGVTLSGTASATTLSATQMSTDFTEATTDHYNGRIIIWTSGALTGQATDITGYSGTNGTFTFTAVTDGGPANGDTFVIV